MVKQVINVGTTANDRTGDPLRIAFQKANDNFTELYTTGGGTPSSLVNGNKTVSLGTNGTLTVPSPTSNVITLTFAASNYVATGLKPTLTLTGAPWALQGQYGYNSRGETELMLNSIWPTLNNPGYTSGDSFTFNSSVHGIVGYILTIQLNDVVLPGGAGWTANVAASQPPEYPSTITSQGAIKVTSDNNDWIFGTDGGLTLPGEVYIKNGISGAIIGDSASSGLNINTYDAAPFGLNWYSTSIFGAPNTNPNPGDPAWDISSSAINFGWNGISIIVNDSLNNSPTWVFGPDAKLTTPTGLEVFSDTGVNCLSSNSGLALINIGFSQLSMVWGIGETELPNLPAGSAISTSVYADSGGLSIEVIDQNSNSNIWDFRPNGKLKIPLGGDIVDSLGNSVLGANGPNPNDLNLDIYKIANGVFGTKNNPDTGGWGFYNIILDPGGESNSRIVIPSATTQGDGAALEIYNNASVNSTIQLRVNGGDYTFGSTELQVKTNASIKQNNAFTRVTTPIINSNQTNSVIWTAILNTVSSVKLTIQLETDQVGDATGWHSQVCEVIVASRGYANVPGYGEPIMTVYGVTYTSTLPLVTFTVQRNPTTSLIEIVGTRTAETNTGINFRIHSVEMISRD